MLIKKSLRNFARILALFCSMEGGEAETDDVTCQRPCKEQPLSWELTMELLPHVWRAGEGSSGINREQDIPRGRKSLQNILASNEAAHLRVLHFR